MLTTTVVMRVASRALLLCHATAHACGVFLCCQQGLALLAVAPAVALTQGELRAMHESSAKAHHLQQQRHGRHPVVHPVRLPRPLCCWLSPSLARYPPRTYFHAFLPAVCARLCAGVESQLCNAWSKIAAAADLHRSLQVERTLLLLSWFFPPSRSMPFRFSCPFVCTACPGIAGA